uniref:Uncharacterized protein n=5 Tax=Cercopithecinae TaxID=9528 RepID=Q95JL2_MACFA|nr:hypothetical protein [Macaca fascicularis]
MLNMLFSKYRNSLLLCFVALWKSEDKSRCLSLLNFISPQVSEEQSGGNCFPGVEARGTSTVSPRPFPHHFLGEAECFAAKYPLFCVCLVLSEMQNPFVCSTPLLSGFMRAVNSHL